MAAKTTNDAVQILHGLFVKGRPDTAAALEEARERLRLSLQIHELREREGLTQEELAERAGTSRTVIARLESPGYDKHTMSTLRKVAGAMGYGVRVQFVPIAKKAVAAKAKKKR